MGALISAASMVSVLGLVLAPAARAQSLADRPAERGPRFLLASASVSPAKLSPVDVGRTPILKRKLSLDLRGATVAEALVEVSNRSGLTLVYSDDVVAGGDRVDLRADGISVAAALTEVLLDAGVDVVFESGSRAALVRRPPRAQEGTIVGRVTDVRSGTGLQEALVGVEGTQLSASTGADGSYRIPNVLANTSRGVGRRIRSRMARSLAVRSTC